MSDTKLNALSTKNNASTDSIARIAYACREIFHDIADAFAMQERVISRVSQLLKRSAISQKALVTLDDLNDEFEQFRVWTRNLGVFASDQASLDYRLREAEDVKNSIASLLSGFQADLDAIQFLLYQDRKVVESKQDDSSEDTDSSSDESELLDDTSRSAFELQARLQRVISTVNKLMQIAEVIRASNPSARMTKAAKYIHYENGVNMTEQFEKEYLPFLLEHRYKVKASLIDRLVKAISLRRRKFQYQAKHQQRLAYPGDRGLEASRTNASLINRRLIPVGVPMSQPKNQKTSLPSGIASNSNVLTVATTFKKLQVKKTAPSTIISASNKSTAGNPDIPPPPWIPARATHFQCPYCCILMPERNFLVGKGTFSKQLWAKHVIADLQPYICLEDECSTPHTQLESQEDWLSHQKWQHTMEWWCEGEESGHEPLKFDTIDHYIEHAQNSHGGTHESANTQASVAGRPSMFPFNACPFCDFDANKADVSSSTKQGEAEAGPNLSRSLHAQKTLQNHIADELLNIFLIALPERDDIKDIQTDTSRPVVKGSTIKALDDISLSFPNTDDSEKLTTETNRFPLAFELSSDPYITKREPYQIDDWEDVWTSPQLQECVRSTYTGFEYDDRLQEMLAIKDKDNEQEIEIELWIPYLTLGDEVLVHGRRLPKGIKNYHEIESSDEPVDIDSLPAMLDSNFDDEPNKTNVLPAAPNDSDRDDDSQPTRSTYADFFMPEELRSTTDASPQREIID